jgi:hypothetical protein
MKNVFKKVICSPKNRFCLYLGNKLPLNFFAPIRVRIPPREKPTPVKIEMIIPQMKSAIGLTSYDNFKD